MKYNRIIFLILAFITTKNTIGSQAKKYDQIIRFLQHEDDEEEENDDEESYQEHDDHEDDDEEKETQLNNVKEEKSDQPMDNSVVEEPKSTPSWVDEDDLLAELESSQTERANDLSIKALQKKRAANSLRVYCEGIQEELKKAKNRTNGMKKLDSYKLTSQLEANLARAFLLYKQAELLDEKAKEAKKSLELLHSNDKGKLLIRDCNMLKIGPLSYSPRGDDIMHKSKEPLMAKLTGNSLILYHNKLPQLTYYMVDIEMPAKPVESASRCLSIGYRGADQVFCAATEESAHSWINAISEAWFCKHMGIKGTLINLKNIKPRKEHAKGLLKHAIKDIKKDKGLINMEVYVDDKNKTHLKVEGKEKPLSAVSDIIDVNQIVQDKMAAKEKKKDKNKSD